MMSGVNHSGGGAGTIDWDARGNGSSGGDQRDAGLTRHVAEQDGTGITDEEINFRFP
jgi:hypothetical protein